MVADDHVVQAAREEAAKETGKPNEFDWEKVSAAAILATSSLRFSPYAPIALVAVEAIKAWAKARKSGLKIVAISKSEANNLTFPPGHPRDNILYIGHPANAKSYYTTAEFHRMTFEHKFAEAIKLLMSLGTTEIQVEHIRGWSQDFSSRLSVPLQHVDAHLSAELKHSKGNKSHLLFKASLGGSTQPKLPPTLIWYPHECTWQALASARLEYGLREFSLNVTYNDDYGINAGLKLSASKAGLDLGGSFEDHVSTEWRISGVFRNISTP